VLVLSAVVGRLWVGGSDVPAWYPLGAAFVMLIGTTFGGVLYLRSAPVAVGRA
jgi:hypothetical protein